MLPAAAFLVACPRPLLTESRSRGCADGRARGSCRAGRIRALILALEERLEQFEAGAAGCAGSCRVGRVRALILALDEGLEQFEADSPIFTASAVSAEATVPAVATVHAVSAKTSKTAFAPPGMPAAGAGRKAQDGLGELGEGRLRAR